MRPIQLLILPLFTVLILLSACAGGDEEKSAAKMLADNAEYDTYESAQSSDVPASDKRAASASVLNTSVSNTSGSGQATQHRKIIYNADIALVVDDFEGVPNEVNALAKRFGGFIAGSRIRGNDGSPRSGEWTLRIPSANYDAFVEGSKTLGQLRSSTSRSKEVTAEFVDLQARLKNLRASEARLHEHLNKSTKQLNEILTIEREIARVRGDIERIEGQLNVLKDLTALSTVTLQIEEIKNFVPEPTEEPGYTTQVARAWGGSVDALGGFFTSVSIGLVGMLPWLVVLVPIGSAGYLIAKRMKKAGRQGAAVA